MKKLFLILLLIFVFGCVNEASKEEIPGEEFCGSSTYKKCSMNRDCVAGGCSGQICGGITEELISTCEYAECYNANKYNLECKCVDKKCQWS